MKIRKILLGAAVGGAMVIAAGPAAWAGVSPGPAQSFENCYYGYFCMYSGTNWTGQEFTCASSYVQGGEYWCLPNACANDCPSVKSWVNYTAYRAWLQQYPSHTNGGVEYCATPRYGNSEPSASSDFTSSAAGDRYYWMSGNTASC